MGGFIQIVDLKCKAMLLNIKGIGRIIEATLEDTQEEVCVVYPRDGQRIIVKCSLEQMQSLIEKARQA